jgi:hypothetical protein
MTRWLLWNWKGGKKGVLEEFNILSGFSLSGTNKTTKILSQASWSRFEPVTSRIQSCIVIFAIKSSCFFCHSIKSCLLHRLQKSFHRCKDKCESSGRCQIW